MKNLLVYAIMAMAFLAIALKATEEGQPELSGKDTGYVHGSWCVDGRAF